jgi:flagellar biosynthetic protein FlhB
MQENKQSRTEKPTPRRLRKAREKGQTARSKEVPSAMILTGVFIFLFFAGEGVFEDLMDFTRELLRFTAPHEFNMPFVNQMARTVMSRFTLIAGPIILTILMLGIGANLAQGRLTFSGHQLGFRFEKLKPSNGLSRIFSKNGVVELIKNVVMVLAIALIALQVITDHLPIYPRLIVMDVRQLLYWVGTITFQVCIRIGAFLLLIALADFAFQKYRFLEKMKMTKREVKDEFKETEGDPLTRSRIRRIQREMARKRMMAAVPEADVVITNPTHYAIALSYKMDTMEAPRVVAKGVGFLAIKIKELAQKHDIPMVENPSLAQTLYKSAEVGTSIPVDLYRAVAEILAYIYKARNRWQD